MQSLLDSIANLFCPGSVGARERRDSIDSIMAYKFGETIVSGEKGNATGGVFIFLHGLGDTGHGWAGNMDQLRLPGVRFVCPTAPTQPVTLNGGMPMPAWFDLPMMGPQMFTNIDWKGVAASAHHVHTLIEAEVAKGVPSQKIVVGGFSQGGAVALRAAMYSERKLAGVVMLSSFVGPVDDLQPGKIPTVNSKVSTYCVYFPNKLRSCHAFS
eukprot:9480797-Pyramimonas_sp.AAC.1